MEHIFNQSNTHVLGAIKQVTQVEMLWIENENHTTLHYSIGNKTKPGVAT